MVIIIIVGGGVFVKTQILDKEDGEGDKKNKNGGKDDEKDLLDANGNKANEAQ